jgi:TonB family protein
VSAKPSTRTALLASTLAHAALLGALLLAVRPPPVKGPFSVRLLVLPPEEAGAEGTGHANAAPEGRPQGPTQRRTSKPRPATAAGPVDTEASVPASALAADTLMATPVLASLEGPTAGGGVAVGAASAGLLGARKGGALGGSRLGELHRRLAEAAVRCYPAAARRFRLTGEVPLHFCLDAGGTATALSLEGSTGWPLLDRSALECVVPGAQPLSGFEGCFLVPVRFGG